MATAATRSLPLPDVWSHALLKRLASILVLLPVFLLIVVRAPAWVFSALVVVVSAAALWELLRMLERGGRPVYRWLGVVIGTAVTAAFAASGSTDSLTWPVLTLILGVGLVMVTPVWQGAPGTEAVANTVLAVLYVGWLLGFAILLHQTTSRGDEPLLFVVGVTWVGDTSAYLVGSSIGRHKLAPVISPGKTIEGAVAQVVASVLVGLGLGTWLLPFCGPLLGAAAGALLGIAGQLGDLAESAIKRDVGTKDTGALIPGHGGMLDRIDSLLFNLPAYYYFSLLTGCR